MSFNECSNILSMMSYTGNEQKNFFDYVYFRIAQNNQNRFVEKNSDSIDIILSDHPSIKVIPVFENMDKNNINIEQEQIDDVIEIVQNSEFKYVYFVYPKNDNFDKHIQVKVPKLEDACSEYMVKLIPYSLESLNKKEKCNGNCNILCK